MLSHNFRTLGEESCQNGKQKTEGIVHHVVEGGLTGGVATVVPIIQDLALPAAPHHLRAGPPSPAEGGCQGG